MPRRALSLAERALWAAVGVVIDLDERVHELLVWLLGLADGLRRSRT